MVPVPCMEGYHRWGYTVCGRGQESDTCWVASFKDGIVYGVMILQTGELSRVAVQVSQHVFPSGLAKAQHGGVGVIGQSEMCFQAGAVVRR